MSLINDDSILEKAAGGKRRVARHIKRHNGNIHDHRRRRNNFHHDEIRATGIFGRQK